MSDQGGLLSNPRDLFLRPHLFIVHSEADEDDRQLARSIAHQCDGFTRPQCGTVAQLIERSAYRRIFLGITIVILSPSMLADPAQRAALLTQMSYAYQQTLFRHYCVCRGISAESLREYPELDFVLDNVMAGDSERSLPAIIAEVHDFATRVLPSSPELSRPVTALFYRRGLRRTLSGFALGLSMLVTLASSLAAPAAAALAVFWWQEWTLPGTTALIWFVAFCAGFRLNHLQSGDLWPWLRECWKLPRRSTVTASKVPRLKVAAIGPLSIAGVLVARSFARASGWTAAAACAAIGLMAQSILDYGITRHIRSRLTLGGEAERALEVVEAPEAMGSRLSMEGLYRSAGGVMAAFYGAALMSTAVSALMIVPAYLVARRLTPAPVIWVTAATVAGYLLPGIIERFTHSGITYIGEYAGLSSADTSLYKKLAGTPNAKLTIKGVPADERALVESFTPDEQKYVLQWLNSIRIGLMRNRSYRSWSPATDFAFISYAWQDDTENSAASAIAAACQSTTIEYFLDKVTLNSREGVFRMPVASGLSKSTHVFLVVTPGLASGQVARREIEMAMGRWRGEFLPAIICVVDPHVGEQLMADPAVPLPLRFLLRFCPRMTPAEAAHPALVRYVVELTRREGKWNDWRLLLSPSTAFAQVIRLPGIVQPVA
jgi:hypothetical protein